MNQIARLVAELLNQAKFGLPGRWKRLGSLTLSCLIVSSSWTFAGDLPSQQEFEALQGQLAIGEYQSVMDIASEQIETIRSIGGGFDRRLAQPYLMLGDAQMGMGEADDAVESFTSALNVVRMNDGLKATTQTDALYRLSNSMSSVGDYQSANEAQELAYAIMLEHFGTDDPRLLPSMLNLIDWYEANRRFSAAKILYIDAIKLAVKVIPAEDKRRVDLARAFAKGMRNTVFPPMDGETRFRPFEILVPGYKPPPPGARPPSSYSLGQEALVEIRDFVMKTRPDDTEKNALAKLNLADWHQLFGKESQALRMYREIWQDLASLPELQAEIFDEPRILYIRLPKYPNLEADSELGIVNLLLTVSYRGTATGRISQVVEPPNEAIEFRTRVAAREARFRPALKDGKPVTTRNFELTHTYPLPRQRL